MSPPRAAVRVGVGRALSGAGAGLGLAGGGGGREDDAVQRSKPRLSPLGAWLFAIGALPWLMWLLVVAAGLVWPQVTLGLLFDLFEPPEVDAPDNWAVA